MMIDDLNDEMLREILCLLPCYRTTSRCKAVSKRWYSIISDPLFITQCFLMHREIKEEEPSSVFLLTTMGSSLMWDDKFVAAMVAPPCFQRTLWSPFLSLQFLPSRSTLVATFKDLTLSYTVDPLTCLPLYYICNPLTKQWMVLPPSQVYQNTCFWAALTCLDGRRFRVVVACSRPVSCSGKDYPFIMINLLIYISETCQWRNIDVTLQLKSSNARYYGSDCFTSVVCKGMVCIHYGMYFGAFSPFDVTDTSHGTLTAIDLPSPGREVTILLESDGKLVALEDHYITLRFNYERPHWADFLFGQCIWKYDMRLNNDEQLSRWELILRLEGNIKLKGSRFITRPDHISKSIDCTFKVVGVHPSKDHLIYLIQEEVRDTQSWLILFDTKSKTLESLTKTIPPHGFLMPTCPKLDIPCWPTPIPIP